MERKAQGAGSPDSYSEAIQQKARDLENVVQMVQMLHTCMNQIPCMLHDVMLAHLNGSPIRDSRRRGTQVSVLSALDKVLLMDCQHEWIELTDRYIPDNTRTQLLELALDYEFCERIALLTDTLRELHTRLYS